MPLRKRSTENKAEEAARVAAGEAAIALPLEQRRQRVRALVAQEAEAFITRRHNTIRRLKLAALKPNLFLLRLTREIHGLETPEAIVDHLVEAHVRAGDETAYGWFVDLFLPPLFGASTPPEREDPYKWEGYKEMDKEALRPNPETGKIQRHMISMKAGPFTINDTMAHRMAANVRSMQQYGTEPVVYGVTYGRREQLSNKPGIVKADFPDDRVAILVGREFWDWLAGYQDAHLDIFEGIGDGETAFQKRTGLSVKDVLQRQKMEIAAEFIKEFKIRPGDDLWQRLTETGF